MPLIWASRELRTGWRHPIYALDDRLRHIHAIVHVVWKASFFIFTALPTNNYSVRYKQQRRQRGHICKWKCLFISPRHVPPPPSVCSYNRHFWKSRGYQFGLGKFVGGAPAFLSRFICRTNARLIQQGWVSVTPISTTRSVAINKRFASPRQERTRRC